MQIQHLTLSQQYQLFQQVKEEVAYLLGQNEAQKFFREAIYSFTVGGNDYINNYVLSDSPRRQQLSPPRFLKLLISTFRTQLLVMPHLQHLKLVLLASALNLSPSGMLQILVLPVNLCLLELASDHVAFVLNQMFYHLQAANLRIRSSQDCGGQHWAPGMRSFSTEHTK